MPAGLNPLSYLRIKKSGRENVHGILVVSSHGGEIDGQWYRLTNDRKTLSDGSRRNSLDRLSMFQGI